MVRVPTDAVSVSGESIVNSRPTRLFSTEWQVDIFGRKWQEIESSHKRQIEN